MRLYIAGPMTGLPDLNYPAFMDAEGLLDVKYDILNPARIDDKFPIEHEDRCETYHSRSGREVCTCGAIDDRTWTWYMRKAIAMVCEADGVACLPHWQESRGARIEVDLARTLGMRCESVGVWLTL